MQFNRRVKDLLLRVRGERSLAWYVARGMTVGKNVDFQHGVRFDYSHAWLITIGDNVTIAPEAYLIAHDASTIMALGHARIGNIVIGSRVFVGARTVVLPGVSIGDDVIVGAGSVVTKSIPSGSVAAGNPARIIGNTSDFIDRNRVLMERRPVYDASWTARESVSMDRRRRMRGELDDGLGFVE